MKKAILMAAGVIGLWLCPAAAQASEFNFSVNAEIPENQLDKSVGYFDIKLAPGGEQTLHVNLQNDTDQDVRVDVSLANATTNVNGVVEYSPNGQLADPSLKHRLTQLVSAPGDVLVPAHGSSVLDLNVKMPAEAFDGLIAGGITLQEHKEAADAHKKQQGLAITNEYAYVLGLVMRQNEQPVAPQLTLKDVVPSQLNYRNVILAQMHNDAATYINKVVVDEVITKKGSKTALYEHHQENMQIAPNSSFDFPLPLEGEKLAAGTYVAQLTVYGNQKDGGSFTRKSGDTPQQFLNKWTFEKEFTIKAADAKKLNAKDVTIKETFPWIPVLLGILAILLIILIILLIWALRRKRNHEK